MNTARILTAVLVACSLPNVAGAESDRESEVLFSIPVTRSDDQAGIVDEAGVSYDPTWYGEAGQLALPPELYCSEVEVWFDGACREKSWIDANLTVSGTSLMIIGSRYKDVAGTVPSEVVVAEQIVSDVIEHAAIREAAVGAAISGPVRGHYPVRASYRQQFNADADGSLTVLSEYAEPRLSNQAPAGWVYETLDWSSVEYRRGSNPVYCNPDECIMAYSGPSGAYQCQQLSTAATSQLYHQCMTGYGAVMIGVGVVAGAALGILAFSVLTGPTVGLGAPAGATVGVAIASGTITGAAGMAHIACSNRATQQALQQQIQLNCVNPTNPTGSGPGSPGTPGSGTGSTATAGCLECLATERQEVAVTWEVGTDENGEEEDTLTVHTETVCTEWVYNAEGQDRDGDGYCD